MRFLEFLLNPEFIAYLPTALVLVIGIIGGMISKEQDFDVRCRKLKKDFLQMKVNALTILIEQIIYPPETLDTANDVNIKDFFIDIEKYSKFEKKLRWRSWFNNFANNFLFFGIITSIIFGTLLVLSILQIFVIVASLILLFLEIVLLILTRIFQQKIRSMENIDELARI